MNRHYLLFILCCGAALSLGCRTAQFVEQLAPADTVVTPPKREFRAAWIASVDNIDWPSRKGLTTDEQQREFRDMIELHQRTGLNAVIVQVRDAADALYARSTEPWSEWLTGQQGLAPDPFYDPLEFMIQESHSRGLEFHAWLNLDRATFSRNASIAPSHISFQHPEWLYYYDGRKVFNLGLPEVRAYISGIVANLVRNYDVDGIHFDDYFYPYTVVGQRIPDGAAYARYGRGMSLDDWRRSNVDALIVQLRDSIRAQKSYVKFGISPFGVWRNQRDDPAGSATLGGQTAYDNLYADTRKWVREGWIDYLVPQVYFGTDFAKVPFRTLVDWWTLNCPNRHLYIGHGAYRLAHPTKTDLSWGNPAQLSAQMRHIRKQPKVAGSVFFSGKTFQTNPHSFRDSLQAGPYRYHALIPTMPWLDSIPPRAPRGLAVAATGDGIELYWQQPNPAVDKGTARYYVVYRLDGSPAVPGINDPRTILAVLMGELSTRFVDKTADPAHKYTYVVTAVDRLHNESEGASVYVSGL